ncbi:MAG: HAD family phosphatase [Lachnospiraceae bacterium]
MNIEGAIFDLDGTLLDSMFVWDSIGEEYLLSRGVTPEPGLNIIFKKMSIVQAAQYYKSEYKINDSIEEIINGVNGMVEHYYLDVVCLKSGILPLLKSFQNRGIKMCVATATDRYLTEAALRRNGIYDYFTQILTCTEVGFGKDSPVIYERAREELRTPKETTLIFEDAIHAILTAKAAGFPVVGIYDHSSKKDQNDIKENSDVYLTSFEEWREIN